MARKRILIRRKAYTRKDGTRVKATSFYIKDPGTPGRRARGSKAGPFKGTKPWITREGKLGGPGYTTKAASTRHGLLGRSVSKYGYRSTLGSVQVLLRDTEISPAKRRKLMADKAWLKRKYGRSAARKRRK